MKGRGGHGLNLNERMHAVKYDESKLYFSRGNAKLSNDIAIFSLPAGWTCPGAKDCMARADKETGAITDGKHMKFRCYAANSERQYKRARLSRWKNFNLLKGKSREEMATLIYESIPEDVYKIRIHESGDFFSEAYFLAWCDVARAVGSKVTFYAYTKSLNTWVRNQEQIPENLVLTASRGGQFDELIDEHGLNQCEVVFSEDEAKDKELEIDHDDSHAINGDTHFALLLHGMQPEGSEAREAVEKLWEQNKGSYCRSGSRRCKHRQSYRQRNRRRSYHPSYY